MNKRIAFLVLLLALPVYTAANPTVIPVKIENPASTFCEDQEFILEIGTAADGSQSGVCVFLDGSECDEWVCYRGDCGPGTVVPSFTPQRTD